MPETQQATLHCPQCGAPILAVFQQLTGWALLNPGEKATATPTLTWEYKQYLRHCRQTGEIPTLNGFADWARENMARRNDPPSDNVYYFSVELKRHPTL